MILSITTTEVVAQTIQQFELTNVINGTTVSSKNYSSNPAIIIIVSTIHCPYTEYYIERIKKLAEVYKGRVPIVLINGSIAENESTNAMAAFAAQHGITFPYLDDKEQKVSSILNPRKSPEVFLLHNAAGKFKTVYRGAFDDNPQSADEVKHAYLQEALEQLLASKKIIAPEVRPVGCSLK